MDMLCHDVARIRRATVWVVSVMVTCVPRLVLNCEGNLENLMQKIYTLLEKDGPQVQYFAGQTFANVFTEANKVNGQSTLLNKFYKPVIALMFTEVRKEDSQEKGLLSGLIDSINTIVEECDSAQLKDTN